MKDNRYCASPVRSWLLVTKKLPFIISEFEMVQATFWNTNNGGKKRV